jgi:hypothetical protein
MFGTVDLFVRAGVSWISTALHRGIQEGTTLARARGCRTLAVQGAARSSISRAFRG